MQNILVPTDFSPEAHNAFEVALQVAHRTGGHITLLHVVSVPGSSGVVSTGSGTAGGGGLADVFMLKLLQVTKQRMLEWMVEAYRDMPDVPVEDLVQTGPVDEAILEVIRSRHIDLLVVGSHEQTPGTHFFADSGAERLVRLSPCPVLTVKHPAHDFEVRHLVFASDFTAEADRAVPSLQRLRAAFPDALLHLLDVEPSVDRHQAALDRIHDFARRHQLGPYEPDVFDAPKVSAGIPRFAEQAHADLVVMLTHGRTGLRHFLQGSIAENVAVHAAAPVLTLHPQDY
ncbi:universal stress protein [Hymenobacter sp. CRA2]|uniref:universal stress protein n=1 Tax=Hymenobacter sp. CRA2 TaxID=1955620 RepID=UPI00098EE082|nr:universal stress protein [Hymenobacter sp. CRA2]OON66454.1 hypothetical protein B0919_21710 [Hymenobacter sp. CRA2]